MLAFVAFGACAHRARSACVFFVKEFATTLIILLIECCYTSSKVLYFKAVDASYRVNFMLRGI